MIWSLNRHRLWSRPRLVRARRDTSGHLFLIGMPLIGGNIRRIRILCASPKSRSAWTLRQPRFGLCLRRCRRLGEYSLASALLLAGGSGWSQRTRWRTRWRSRRRRNRTSITAVSIRPSSVPGTIAFFPTFLSFSLLIPPCLISLQCCLGHVTST